MTSFKLALVIAFYVSTFDSIQSFFGGVSGWLSDYHETTLQIIRNLQ